MRISGIPTSIFYRIVSDLCSEQWQVVSEYAGFDKGIDYDLIVLKKRGIKIKFLWVLYHNGSMEGPDALLQELGERYSLM